MARITTIYIYIFQTITYGKYSWDNMEIGKKLIVKIRTEYILSVVVNNAIRSNYAKTKLYNTKKKILCRLCDDRGKIVKQ